MDHSATIVRCDRRPLRGSARPFTFIIFLLLFGTAIFAYKHIFHRAGEEATSLIPADSIFVVTADLGPAPDQVALFARITKAISDEKLEGPLEESIAASTNGNALMKELRPQLGLSYAMAGWQKVGSAKAGDTDVVGIAAVKSASEAEAIVAKHGVLENHSGQNYYRINGEKMYVAIIRQYLVVSDGIDRLQRVASVAHGDSPAIASVAAFKEARERLPSDANLMAFVDMGKATEAMQSLVAATGTKTSVAGITGWGAGSATLRDTGVEFLWKTPTGGSNSMYRIVEKIKPIETAGLYRRLPAAPYGLISLAQPGQYLAGRDALLSSLGASDKKGIDEGISSFEKETHMSIEKDIAAGLMGNMTLAVYPARDRGTPIPDGMIVLDEQNGADPAAMLEKVKTVITDESRKNGGTAPKFLSEQKNGATIWSLDDATEKSLRSQSGIEPPQSLPPSPNGSVVNINANGVRVATSGAQVQVNGNSVTVGGNNGAVQVGPGNVQINSKDGAVNITNGTVQATAPNGQNVTVDANGVHIGKSTPPTVNPIAAPEVKQLVWAVIGKSVVIASSRSLLDKAIAAQASGTGSIATDNNMLPMLKQVVDSPQQMMVVDLHSIMEAMRTPLAAAMTGPDSPKLEDVIRVFGTNGAGFVCSQGYENSTASAKVLFPLDYERLIHIIALANKSSKSQKNNARGFQPTGNGTSAPGVIN